jgi:SAM-dependent methyltransferase
MKRLLYEKFNSLLYPMLEREDLSLDLIAITVNWQSGAKAYEGRITLIKDEKQVFQYQLTGRSGQAGIAELADQLAAVLLPADSCRVDFNMRGGGRRIEADDKGVRMQTLATDPDENSKSRSAAVQHEQPISSNRDYRIRTDEAATLLRGIGILNEQGKIRNDRIRKYHQIDRFVELIEPFLLDLAQKEERLTVVDMACGKSDLSFVLNYYLREKMGKPCQFVGIDRAPGVIESANKLASQLGYRNMQFQTADLATAELPNPIHVAISLHACDIATDLALYRAATAGASLIACVPCCQRELLASGYRMPGLEHSVMEHGVLKARMADILTDAMRLLILRGSGYDTRLIEYVSPLDTPKNLLLIANRTGRADPKARAEYELLVKTCGSGISMGRLMGWTT